MDTKPDWTEIERRIRAGESARAISRDLKISHTAINKHCKRGGWKLPEPVKVKTPKEKTKSPQRRILWRLRRDGTAVEGGYYRRA